MRFVFCFQYHCYPTRLRHFDISTYLHLHISTYQTFDTSISRYFGLPTFRDLRSLCFSRNRHIDLWTFFHIRLSSNRHFLLSISLHISISQYANISTHRNLDISTYRSISRPLSLSTSQHPDTSTYRRIDITTCQDMNVWPHLVHPLAARSRCEVVQHHVHHGVPEVVVRVSRVDEKSRSHESLSYRHPVTAGSTAENTDEGTQKSASCRFSARKSTGNEIIGA